MRWMLATCFLWKYSWPKALKLPEGKPRSRKGCGGGCLAMWERGWKARLLWLEEIRLWGSERRGLCSEIMEWRGSMLRTPWSLTSLDQPLRGWGHGLVWKEASPSAGASWLLRGLGPQKRHLGTAYGSWTKSDVDAECELYPPGGQGDPWLSTLSPTS